MGPEAHREAEKPVLEHDISVAYERLLDARRLEDPENELRHEGDMNEALEAYTDLTRAIGGVGVNHSD